MTNIAARYAYSVFSHPHVRCAAVYNSQITAAQRQQIIQHMLCHVFSHAEMAALKLITFGVVDPDASL